MNDTIHQSTKFRRFLVLAVLHAGVLISSLGSVCAMLAANKPMFSPLWILLYCGYIVSMGIYAILWQQVLKRMTLISAFLNRSIKVLWTMLWGALFFKERLSFNMIIGVVIVIVGICVMVYSDEE